MNVEFMDFLVNVASLMVGVIVPAIGGIYVLLTNTRRYELTTQLRTEILCWYSETTKIMIEIIHYIDKDIFYTHSFTQDRISLLSKLSSQIEIGRFYFPNVPSKEQYGKSKPLAYQGHRHAIVEFVYQFYRQANAGLVFRSLKSSVHDGKRVYFGTEHELLKAKESRENRDRLCDELWKLEREFTSEFFAIIKPRERNKEHNKRTELYINEELNYYTYLLERNEKKNRK